MKLIVLDRDGVINECAEHFIASPDEWIPLPGALEALAKLSQWGWRIVLTSHQSGIGRGLYGMDLLNAINERLHKTLAQQGGRIDAFFFCPHTIDAGCDCYTPEAGLLAQIVMRFNCSLRGLKVVSDDLQDLQLAAAVQADPCLVRTGRGEQTASAANLPPSTQVYSDLSALVATLIE